MTHSLISRVACSTAVCLASLPFAHASTKYVRADAPPGGNGASWATAFDTVQAGIAAAVANDQVWVKAGTYRPGTAASPRTVTFQLKNGVGVYGGFDGTETALAQRDWVANQTILSGDLLQDDAPSFVNRADNVYHVVNAIGNMPGARLDGFFVRGGNADGLGPGQGQGGGIYGANATLRNLTIEDNQAFAGGALVLPDASSAAAPIERCVFRGNTCQSGGGGILINAGFFVVRDCVIASNYASFGGGVYIYIDGQSPGAFVNCLFVDNLANSAAAGISSSWCALDITNCVIAYNHSGNGYGGLSGGGQPSAAVNVRNSILWGNSNDLNATTFQQQVSSAAILSDTAVEGGPAPLNADPMWTDPAGADLDIGTADDDFTLACTSPYIDAGNNAHAAGIVLDLAGNARFADDPATPDTGSGTAPIVDLGPYEFTCACNEYESYCTALPNSSGLPASIGASGSTSISANNFVLEVTDAPAFHNGLFFYGPDQIALPWGDGIRCVGGSLIRLPVVTVDGNGVASFALDFTLPPAGGGPGQIFEGAHWNFEFYFRDTPGGPMGWNASNGLSVVFCR